MGYLDESEVVVKRETRVSGGESSRRLLVSHSALGGESPDQGSSQSIGANSGGWVQSVARIFGYAAMS